MCSVRDRTSGVPWDTKLETAGLAPLSSTTPSFCESQALHTESRMARGLQMISQMRRGHWVNPWRGARRGEKGKKGKGRSGGRAGQRSQDRSYLLIQVAGLGWPRVT